MSNKEWGGVILNTGCSNFCVFCISCSNSHRRIPKARGDELRRQEINIAKNLINFKRKGLKQVEISGSDPIEYDKIVPLIRYIKKIGFEFVQLSTHGKRLSDKSFLNELITSGIDKLRIPLYGSNAKVHDSVTRTKGSFNAVINGIKKLLEKAPYIHFQISSLVVQQNKNNLIDLVDLVKGLGIKDFYFSIPYIASEDTSFYIPLKDLSSYVREVYSYASKISYDIKFIEISYCVFGRINESINNASLPPDLGRYCQPLKEFRTSIKDLPSYRIKKKIDICKDCKASDFCDGFFVNDVDKFGVGNLKPI